MKIVTLVPLLILLAGCGPNCTQEVEQEEHKRLFKECMKLLPAGPKTTQYNDWDDVVQACDTVAFRQATKEVCE